MNLPISMQCLMRAHWGRMRTYDDVIKWKHFPRYWPFVRGIHRWPVNSLHKGQWCGALMFSLICTWINGWVNNREAGGLRRHRAHYDVRVMSSVNWVIIGSNNGPLLLTWFNFNLSMDKSLHSLWHVELNNLRNFTPHFTRRVITYIHVGIKVKPS